MVSATESQQSGFVAILLWVWSTFAIKLALFLFLRRIFRQSPAATIALNFTCVFSVIAFLYSFLSYLLSCFPLGLFWLQAYADVGMKMPVEGSCPVFLERGLAAAGLAISTDVLLFMIPVIGVWGLKMSRGRKIALIGVFFVASL